MVCPKCGVDNADGPAFCRSCGERLAHKGFADARLFAGIVPWSMKLSVIRAVQMTRKYGMVGEPHFKNDVMGVAVGGIAFIMRGIGGKITVAPNGGGSRVGIVWDSDRTQCRQVTGSFWQNLDRITAPGGLKMAQRSMFLNAATIMLIVIAFLSLLSSIDYCSETLDSMAMSDSHPIMENVEAWGKPLAEAAVNTLLCLFAIVAVVLVIRRKSWCWASRIGGMITLCYGLSCVALLLGRMTSSLPYGIAALALAIAATVCVLKAKGEFET